MSNEEKMNLPDVPYLAHEEEMTRMERSVKRWFIGWIITFVALVLTNIGWVIYENQYQDVVTETYTAETDQGGTAVVNGSGEVSINGESKLQENEN